MYIRKYEIYVVKHTYQPKNMTDRHDYAFNELFYYCQVFSFLLLKCYNVVFFVVHHNFYQVNYLEVENIIFSELIY